MCGRFVVAGEHRDLLGLFEIEIEGDNLPGPSWNIRPTDTVSVVIDSVRGDELPVRRVAAARWSLTPSFSPTRATKVPTFNARSETAAEKPFFAASVRSKRAIIPASGYYEWKTVGDVKTPYYIHPPEGMLAFAGLYSWWKDASLANDDPARWVLTTTILTREAVGGLRDIHERTPVALPRTGGTTGSTRRSRPTSRSSMRRSRRPFPSARHSNSMRLRRSGATIGPS